MFGIQTYQNPRFCNLQKRKSKMLTKRCSTSLLIREVNMKTARTLHLLDRQKAEAGQHRLKFGAMNTLKLCGCTYRLGQFIWGAGWDEWVKLRWYTPNGPEMGALRFLFQRDYKTDPQKDTAKFILCGVICGGGNRGQFSIKPGRVERSYGQVPSLEGHGAVTSNWADNNIAIWRILTQYWVGESKK